MSEESLDVIDAGKIRNFRLIKLIGEFDLNDVKSFEENVERILVDEKKYIVLDLSELDYLDSSGIGCLVRLYRDTVGKYGGKFIIYSPKEFIKELFEVSNLTQFWPILEKKEELEDYCKSH